MALPRKHSRSISVDGVDYRWCISMRDAFVGVGHRDRVVVQASEGCRLIVVLPWDWADEPTVRPGQVAAWIRTGIAAGWRPSVRGRDFELSIDNG